MIPIVPDTAVVVKVFLEEEDSPRAHALFRSAIDGTHRLVAPDFMAIEFGNVVWKHVRRSLLSPDEARRTIRRFPFDYVAWLPAGLILPQAFEFASRYGVAVYDGAFLAGASMLGADFVTADRALHRKIGKYLPWVKLLHDIPLPSGPGD